MSRWINSDKLREQISKDSREAFTRHQVWCLASVHNNKTPSFKMNELMEEINSLKGNDNFNDGVKAVKEILFKYIEDIDY